MKVVILTPHMTEKKDDASEISEVGTEEKKNFKDVIPDKVKHPSTGLQLFWLSFTFFC